MKNFLAILTLVIGIVLLIPDKTLAADCDLTLSSAATSRYYCEDNDTMTITSDGSIERLYTNIDAGHDSAGGTASTGVTINNAGTIYSRQSSTNFTGRNTIYFDESTNGTLINSGTISADSHRAVSAGINDDTTNFTLTNSGTIQAWRKAVNARNRTGTTITNNANATIKISASAAITYGGTISEAGSSATHTLNNSGTIQAGGQTIQMQNGKNFTITNFSTGTIKVTGSNQRALWGTSTWGTSSTDNRGTITATLEGVFASTRSGKTLDYTLTNSGTITSSAGNAVKTSAAATEITNSGTITGAADALDLNGTISTVTNTGTLNGSTVDIDNNGAITTLINDQGGSDTLTYDGAVPTNYNVVLNSTSDFGKIDFSNESGSLSFGISDTSTLSANTYASVLQNIAGGNIGNENSYINYNSTYKYRLVANGSNWDLEVANRRTGYKVRITKARFSEIASIFENLNTQGKKSTLTSNLDGLTDAELEKAFKQIGLDLNSSIGVIEFYPDIKWQGLPWDFEFNRIVGEVGLSIVDITIQNKDADIETPNNLLRLISIFNVTDTFEKVTSLDFRKLYRSGFSADKVEGNLYVDSKSVKTINPLFFKSGSSEFKWIGAVSKDKNGKFNFLDLEVVMTLPLREYLPAYALILGGPLTAGVVYIAGKAFERNLDKLSSGKWTISGSLENPKTNFEGWFVD